MKDLVTRILLATDGSAGARPAEEEALRLASACGAALDILHVLEFAPGMDPEFPVNRLYLEELQKQAAPRLDELLARAKSAGEAARHELVGEPAERIVAKAREVGADLIVLGTHGRGGIERILLGSTAERVAATAPCPVLTVRSAGRPAPGLRHILAAVDFSDCSLDALEYAAAAAGWFGASLLVLHVVEPVVYGLDFTLGDVAQGRALRAKWEARLTELTDAIGRRGLSAEPILSGGLPAETIVSTARDRGCDLIVMGTHGRRGVSHLVSGSVAAAVLRRADCPVLTVKSPKFRRPPAEAARSGD
jgi:nucleotide-binding universal stress UspA family protein